MNPGMLDTLLVHERLGGTRDTDGSVIQTWNTVRAQVWARRMKPRGGDAAEKAEPLDKESRKITFRVRRVPFLSDYANGDRLRETTDNNLPAAVWRVLSWTEVEGTRSGYIDLACECIVD